MKIGDVVTLNSGGTAMTVTVIAGDEITCKWFDGSRLVYDVFPAETLRPQLQQQAAKDS